MDREEFDRLLAAEDDSQLLEAIWTSLPEKESRMSYDGDPILVTQYASSEISNGGFHQFYSNGLFDPVKLISYFRLLGANELASCVEDSMAVFPSGKPPKRRFYDLRPIDGKLEKMGITDETFDAVDTRFFQSGDALEELWARRVRENADLYFSYVAD